MRRAAGRRIRFLSALRIPQRLSCAKTNAKELLTQGAAFEPLELQKIDPRRIFAQLELPSRLRLGAILCLFWELLLQEVHLGEWGLTSGRASLSREPNGHATIFPTRADGASVRPRVSLNRLHCNRDFSSS